MSDAQRQFRYKANIKKHLSQLRHLTGRELSPTDLITLAETDLLRERSRKLERLPIRRFSVPFAERNGKLMKDLINKIHGAYQSRIYLWTELANTCGAVWLDSILDFNFEFDFEIDANGVFALESEDLRQKLLLDFSEVESGKLLEVEVSGDVWGAIEPAGD